MTSGNFHRHLVDALEALEREVPAHYQATVNALGDRRIGASIDGEDLLILRSGVRIQALDGASLAEVSVFAATAQTALVDLLDGEVSLLDLLFSERLHLSGAVPELLAVERALFHFLQGAVRAPSFPAILRSFRRNARPS